MKRGKKVVFVQPHNKSIYLSLLVNQLFKQYSTLKKQKKTKLRSWANKFQSFTSPPLLFLCSVRLNWGSNRTFSLTLSIPSETTEWVRCECRSAYYSKCHSKLITSVSRLAVRPSCCDLEKMDGKVATKHRVPWRSKRSNAVTCGCTHSNIRYIRISFTLFKFTKWNKRCIKMHQLGRKSWQSCWKCHQKGIELYLQQ